MGNPLYLKNTLKRKLENTRLFFPLRKIYQNLFDPQTLRKRRAKQEFLREFVQPGSLVFDIGANVGEYSYVCLRLGAKVVAVEPNPDCCNRLRALRRTNLLAVRCEAMSARPGESTLFVGVDTGHSTLSQSWVEMAPQINADYRWQNKISTRVNTLDRLREQYGTPDFIKIDVEGHEYSVLRGMSFCPFGMSFEFHSFTSDETRACLELDMFGTGCTFNAVLGEGWKLVWSDWRSRDEIIEWLSTLPQDEYGDIYVKFKPRTEFFPPDEPSGSGDRR